MSTETQMETAVTHGQKANGITHGAEERREDGTPKGSGTKRTRVRRANIALGNESPGASMLPGGGQLSSEVMTTGLREECIIIQKALRQAGKKDSSVKYKLGQLVQAIGTDPEKYGTSGVGLLAAELGFDKSTLYDCGSVAKLWDKREFKRTVSRAGSKGMPLTFSHLVTLAGVEDKTERERLVNVSLEKQLSVRNLKREIAGIPTKEDEEPAARAAQDLWRGAVALVGNLEKWEKQIEGLNIESLPLDLKDDLYPILEQHQEAAARHARLIDKLGGLLGSPAPKALQAAEREDEHEAA